MSSSSERENGSQGESFNLRFQRLKAEIHTQIVETLDLTKLSKWSESQTRHKVRAAAEHFLNELPTPLNEVDQERLVEELMDEVFGLGPLESLMNNKYISDILVNGPHEVYVERNGRLESTDVVFADDQHLRQIIHRIAAQVGRRTDEQSPMVDARWRDGSRINAILPPLALDGPALSIRRFGVRLNTEDLIDNETMPEEFLTLLRAAVEARINILISGGTGSGKTTMLNALSRFIPFGERLITIEDSAELKLQQSHVIRLETRPANMEGSGEVLQRDLVKNSLRMRPDRIIVGEVRGGEALDMLQAMNTGHEGSLTTIHANDCDDALSRLEVMVSMAGYDLRTEVIRHYITNAIALVVQTSRLRGGPRKVVRISEVLGLENGAYVTRDIFGFKKQRVVDGVAEGEFFATGYVPKLLEQIGENSIALPKELFAKRTLAAGRVTADPEVVTLDDVEEISEEEQL